MRLTVLFSALAACAVLITAAPSAHAAHAATTCKPPKYPGTGYFTSLSVSHTSCTTGKKFVVAYYKCRLKHGKAGRCTSHVMGYSCKETRNTIPTEIDARVTCKDGSKRITHTYQQNT
jgi:hypothetical protein